MTEQPAPQPRVLELDRLLEAAPTSTPERPGALWRLAQADRQLDADLVRLLPDQKVEQHCELEVDMMLVVLTGDGRVLTNEGTSDLAPHTVVWLPRGTPRAIEAGPHGLAYLTTHKKRVSLRIELPTDPEALRLLEAREEESEGGEAACMLPKLCPVCGTPNDGPRGQACSTCAAELAR